MTQTFKATFEENEQTFKSEFDSFHLAKGDDGLSAYEVAVKNGFKGTETEWLESLKGEKGDPYVLTEADKTEIINGVLAELPDGDGVLY